MIKLTKLDESTIAVSLDAIKYVEAMPDTLIIFLNGDSLIVRESVDELIEKSVQVKARIFRDTQQKSPGDRA